MVIKEILYIMFGERWVMVKSFLITLFLVMISGVYTATWAGMGIGIAMFYVMCWCFLWCVAWLIVRCIYLIWIK